MFAASSRVMTVTVSFTRRSVSHRESANIASARERVCFFQCVGPHPQALPPRASALSGG
jgi:hypothetical protein